MQVSPTGKLELELYRGGDSGRYISWVLFCRGPARRGAEKLCCVLQTLGAHLRGKQIYSLIGLEVRSPKLVSVD